MSLDSLRDYYHEYFDSIKQGDAISIELECYLRGQISYDDIAATCIKHGLTNVDIDSDGSIRPPDYRYTSVEFRITGKKSNINGLVKTVKKLQKLFKFNTNSSCGLHVHVDTRQYEETGRVQLAGMYLANLINLGKFITKQREKSEGYFKEMLGRLENDNVSLTSRGFINISDYHNTIELRMFGADSARYHLGALLKTIVGIESSFIKQSRRGTKRAREFFPVLQYK